MIAPLKSNQPSESTVLQLHHSITPATFISLQALTRKQKLRRVSWRRGFCFGFEISGHLPLQEPDADFCRIMDIERFPDFGTAVNDMQRMGLSALLGFQVLYHHIIPDSVVSLTRQDKPSLYHRS